jgi:hypothetical protein
MSEEDRIRGMLSVIDFLLEKGGRAQLREIEERYRSSYARQICSKMRRDGLLVKEGRYYILTEKGMTVYFKLLFKDITARVLFLEDFKRKIRFIYVHPEMKQLLKVVGEKGMDNLFDTLFRALSRVDKIFTKDILPKKYMGKSKNKNKLIIEGISNILNKAYNNIDIRENVLREWLLLLTMEKNVAQKDINSEEDHNNLRISEIVLFIHRVLFHLAGYIRPRYRLCWFIKMLSPYLKKILISALFGLLTAIALLFLFALIIILSLSQIPGTIYLTV